MTAAIAHLFDQPFRKVAGQLPHLDRLGFSHVLVSPPQKSHPSRRWWGRYQPVDFRAIEGPLGDAGDLADLCRRAARRGMAVVADAVLNHMTNHPAFVRMHRGEVLESRLPRFGPQDFHHPEGRARVAGGAPLPQLRTDTPWVRGELKAYLSGLYQLGVRGFRFDAAKHLDPGFLAEALGELPPVLAFGEMVHGSAHDFDPAFLAVIQAYDFPLARTISAAFAPGGDLRALVAPGDHGGALWGPASIRFVNKHDLARRRRAFAAFRLRDGRDRELAHVYLLGHPDGTPAVYYTDLKSRLVKAALRFRRATAGAPLVWVSGDPCTLAWRRGDRAFAALNKSGEWRPLSGRPLGLRPGPYRDLANARICVVDPEGCLHGGDLPPRGAALLLPA